MQNENDKPKEFRPRPEKVLFIGGLCRLLHSPQWNETRYINTCAERLFEGYSDVRAQEIMSRILNSVNVGEIAKPADAKYLVYRINAVTREGQVISQ